MQFATILALALPLVAAMPQATTPTTSAAAPSATPDLEAICESQASTYKDLCPECLHNCATSAFLEQCYYSVFFTINGIQAHSSSMEFASPAAAAGEQMSSKEEEEVAAAVKGWLRRWEKLVGPGGLDRERRT
ncbi:hypothetical protein F5B21DRAFT_503516 [Xylaria acuta]|nr:hypothetical protein F5B21DRAFT_503516 [Xylaria acuta]